MDGFLIIDKPLNKTCTQVGAFLKRTLKVRKVGHMGTLDPLATGVLIMAIGNATRAIPYFPYTRKVYEFSINFGTLTTTGDQEGEIIDKNDKRPHIKDIKQILPLFLGETLQQPPRHSALKIQGIPSYERARRDEDFEPEKRLVKVYDLRLIESESQGPVLNNVKFDIDPSSGTLSSASFRVECEKGFYVRSLAVDVASRVGCLGFVSRLRRVQDGPFLHTQACGLDEIGNIVSEYGRDIFWKERALAVRDFLGTHFPKLSVDNDTACALAQGKSVNLDHPFDAHVTVLIEHHNFPVCLAVVNSAIIHPKRVFWNRTS